jgi:hypothetical protein
MSVLLADRGYDDGDQSTSSLLKNPLVMTEA